jgi:hypothetical protein
MIKVNINNLIESAYGCWSPRTGDLLPERLAENNGQTLSVY